MSLPENPYGKSEALIFASGAASSKIPRYDLIPVDAIRRLAKRFELGLERHKERSWNGRSSQQALTDKEWVIARAAHAIDHALKLIQKLSFDKPLDDDDAAAIAWAGMCLCEATQKQIDLEYAKKHFIKDESDPFVKQLQEATDKKKTSKKMPKRNRRL